MCYVLGNLRAKVLEDLSVRAEVTDLIVHKGSRPRKAGEFGAIPDQIERLNNRVAGEKIKTPVRLGVGGAMEFEIGRLFLINNSDLVNRVGDKFSISLNNERGKVLIGPRRDLRAAEFTQTFSCMDTASGIPKDSNLILNAYRELTGEIQFYDSKGWGKYLLPKSLSEFQEEISLEQERIWSILNKIRTEELGPSSEISLSTPQYFGRADIVEIGEEKTFAILAGEPEAGSLEIILLIEPQLLNRHWSICDGELDRDGKLLNRNIHLVFSRFGRPSLMIRLGPNGICDFGISLEGENLNLCLNQKSRMVLTRLGYL